MFSLQKKVVETLNYIFVFLCEESCFYTVSSLTRTVAAPLKTAQRTFQAKFLI